MGEIIRTTSWADTPLGDTDSWPQSLLTTLSILLHSRFPMVLFWGPDAVTFYNDAYRPVLEQRDQDPQALGKPAKDVWPARWPEIKEKFDHVMQGGDAIWFEDTPVITPRKGQNVEIYWTGSYSHVFDESGKPAGVLITCTDTTEKVLHIRRADQNETNFRNIVKQAPAGIVIFEGPEFIVTMANDDYLAIVDKTEEQLVGKPFFDTLPEIRTLIHPLLTQVLETGTPYYGYEFPVTLIRNGQPEPTWFNFVYQPLRTTTDDKPTGIIVVAHDVTEMVKAREAQVASERTFRNMVKNSPIAMTIFRGDEFRIEYANNRMLETVWRKRESEVMGQRVTDAFPELIDQKYPDLLREVYNTGIPHKEIGSLAYVAGDDGMKRFYLDYEYMPLLGTDGKAWGIMVTVYDTTDSVMARYELEAKVQERTADLQRTNKELEQSNQDLQQFAHVASHDLKEPVRKIKIFSHRLESEFRDAVGPQGQTYLQKILKSTNRIFEMIDGILTYSSLPGTDQPLQPVNLNELFDNLEFDLELLILEQAATIIRPELPTIMAMPDLIYQLFYNLLNNALKFTKKNLPVRVTISTGFITVDNHRYIRIIVADNGIGFNNDQADTIFSTFKRLNSKDQYEGTGLGLSLCKKIAERHGGSISAQGEKDKGAQFTVLLPAN